MVVRMKDLTSFFILNQQSLRSSYRMYFSPMVLFFDDTLKVINELSPVLNAQMWKRGNSSSVIRQDPSR